MTTKKQENYHNLSAQLDELMAWFDGDKLDIDEAIAKYEEAIKLTKKLQSYLSSAENKLTELKSTAPEL